MEALALDDGLRRVARRAVRRPEDEQVRSHSAQRVLAFDAAAAVDDALQERLEQELGARFLVLESAEPVLGVLAEERLEGGADVLARGLADLDVDVDGPVLPAGVQRIQQGQQGGGLAGLSGGHAGRSTSSGR